MYVCLLLFFHTIWIVLVIEPASIMLILANIALVKIRSQCIVKQKISKYPRRRNEFEYTEYKWSTFCDSHVIWDLGSFYFPYVCS